MKNEYIDLGTFKFHVLENGNIQLRGDDGDENHKYINLKEELIIGTVSDVCTSIMNYFFKARKTKNDWAKSKDVHNVNWGQQNERTSAGFNYRILSEYLRKNKYFKIEDFNFPRLECEWMDLSQSLSVDFHRVDPSTKSTLNIADSNPSKHFGNNYPIRPALDREGQFFSTFQPQLSSRIINTRLNLINNSHLALLPEWFFDMRMLVIDTISLLDITLNQIYIKAEYDPLPGWHFDRTLMGSRIGRRLFDKLKWIRQISGKELNIESERQSLIELKDLRNHLNHFDPPSISLTIEEAVKWLNHVLYIARILYKIRITLNLPVSTWLIIFLMQREAIFNPKEEFKQRSVLTNNSGYRSSVWPCA